MRDLGTADPWQESLERSLARRGKLPRSGAASGHRDDVPSPERPERRPEPRRAAGRQPRAAARPASTLRGPAAGRAASTSRPSSARRRRARRVGGRVRLARLLTAGAGGLVLFAVLAIAAGAFGGRGAEASVSARRARATRPATPARSEVVAPVRKDLGTGVGECQPVNRASGYVNPVAGDLLRGERIDQGVDYAGTGTLSALGPARITYVGTSGTGWPGAFIEYLLLDGPDAGCFVYYAEGISPAVGLHAGQIVRAGAQIANIIPGWSTGIELGWGAGTSTKSYALKTHAWSATDDADSVASAAGKSFSALIARLGGPHGRVEH